MTDPKKKDDKPATQRAPRQPDKTKIDVPGAIKGGLSIHQNVNLEVILITLDKVRWCLMETHSHATSMFRWVAPFGILVTLVTTLVVTNFHDYAGYSKEFWSGLFLFATGMMALWLILETIWLIPVLWVAYKSGTLNPVARFIAAIKAES